MKYNTAILPNGLRIIQLPCDSPVVYCGYQINAGARNELPGDEGLAHFCEHMTFKGTSKRSAWNILNCLERVGGDLNAYTKKEDTCFYATIPREYTSRAIDLLTDVVFHSTYPQKEIDKEVEVICDEIESYNDSPADLIYDNFENILFKGHPLGHNVLGSAERVRSFKTEDAKRFTTKYYRPENAIFYLYGNLPSKSSSEDEGAASVKLLQKAFKKCGDSMPQVPVKPIITIESAITVDVTPPTGLTYTICRDTHQAHVAIGCLALNERNYRSIKGSSLDLLNNIIGGPAMNSRLNIKLREHRGLVYTVESMWGVYSDTGYWLTYLGCDEKDVDRCLKLVRSVLDEYRNKPLTEHRLNAAKKQLKGQIGIDCYSNHEAFACDFGCIFLHENRLYDLDKICQRIDAVTPQDIQSVANDFLSPERMTTLIYQNKK